MNATVLGEGSYNGVGFAIPMTPIVLHYQQQVTFEPVPVTLHRKLPPFYRTRSNQLYKGGNSSNVIVFRRLWKSAVPRARHCRRSKLYKEQQHQQQQQEEEHQQQFPRRHKTRIKFSLHTAAELSERILFPLPSRSELVGAARSSTSTCLPYYSVLMFYVDDTVFRTFSRTVPEVLGLPPRMALVCMAVVCFLHFKGKKILNSFTALLKLPEIASLSASR